MSLEALKAVKRAFLNDERWDMTEIGQMVNEAIEKAEKREWIGLTDEQIEELANPLLRNVGNATVLASYEYFARAIEAKLKEKNT